MLDALKYHFRHLTDFSGRDARQTFWYWFLFVFIVNVAISMIATVPIMLEAMSTAFAAAQKGGDTVATQQAMMGQISGSMRTMVGVSLVLGCVNLALMAAPFVRRLHDSGKPGLWAFLTGAFYLGSIVLAWSRIDDVGEIMQQMASARDPQLALELQRGMAADALAGWIPLIMLVVFGVLKSDPGPNKYGTEPVRF